MSPDVNDLNLLLVHADDHRPALSKGPDARSVHARPVEVAQRPDLWDAGADPNDLELQRWGVIAPEGKEGNRLLAAVEPLLQHRRTQQRGEPIKVYRAPARLRQSDAARWKKQYFDTGTNFRHDLPRYQLILGDLDQVPLSLQQIQAADGFVGRLAFDHEQDYEAYVDKLLRWERKPAPHPRGRALLYAVKDGTRATTVGRHALLEPGLALLQRRMEENAFPAREVRRIEGEEESSPGELLQEVQGSAADVLFTLSHGAGPPRRGFRSADEQRRIQGAMSFGREGRLCGEDVAKGSFLPGGLWFMLACFGAGTPDESSYHAWLAELQSAGAYDERLDIALLGLAQRRPFVADLAKAALKNPDGPLGFIGHVDLAWTYSFQERDRGVTNRPARFMEILRSALEKKRFGIAVSELYRFFADTNAELSALIDEEAAAAVQRRPSPADPVRKGHLWMLRQDISAYVLLGDPAVRLPLSEVAHAAPRDLAASFGPPVKLPLDLDSLEEAIGEVLSGKRPIKAIADEYAVDRAELSRLTDIYQAAGRAALTGRGGK